MTFRLSRGGANVPAEVQRWQYFLWRRDFRQVGAIDADFGLKTENAIKYFQMSEQITPTGKLDEKTLKAAESHGYTVVPDNYYKERNSTDWPSPPDTLRSPDNRWRNSVFDCFMFLQRPEAQRPDREAIVIRGACAGSYPDWTRENVIDLDASALAHVSGYPGYLRCHRRAAPAILALLDKWRSDDLLHLAISYAGAFVPRYKRGRAPSKAAGHPVQRSADVPDLSEHAFGSAFDINAACNPLGQTPAVCGRKGSTRELVASANALGFFWGGHYRNRKDGMHFELAKL